MVVFFEFWAHVLRHPERRGLRALQRRLDDVIQLPGACGEPLPVHPTQFSLVTADPAVREFQVLQRGSCIVKLVVIEQGAAEPHVLSRT
jgi:hypothetical protein